VPRTLYTPEIADKICRRLSGGETLSEICRSRGLPAKATVLLWVNEDREGFADRYVRARDMQMEHWADELLEISDDARNDWMKRGDHVEINYEHVQRSKLRSDNRKWLLSKLRPDKYGERVSHVGANGKDLLPSQPTDAASLARTLVLLLGVATKGDNDG